MSTIQNGDFTLFVWLDVVDDFDVQCLFVGCSVYDTKLGQVVPKLIPLFFIMIITLAIVTLIPSLSLWLPHLAGYNY
ncbi:hypothetical protein GI293_001354 [Vibrio fluvialis]|nr:hypothetical protein [Vibrio fluvialis]